MGLFGWAVSLFWSLAKAPVLFRFVTFLTDGVYGRRPTAVGLPRPSRRCSASRRAGVGRAVGVGRAAGVGAVLPAHHALAPLRPVGARGCRQGLVP